MSISLLKILNEISSKPKALILAGSPGAGKSSILDKINLNIKTLNLDHTIIDLAKKEGFTLNQKDTDAENRSKFASAMQVATKKLKTELIPNTIKNREDFILDGTSASEKNTKLLKDELEEAGYEVMMLYVYAPLDRVLKRNRDRFEKTEGKDRSLIPTSVLRTWFDVAKNFNTYKSMFGSNFISVASKVDEDNLKDVKEIYKIYVEPFKAKDAKPKTEKEILKSKEQSKALALELQEFINSKQVQDIIDNSVKKKEARHKIRDEK